MWRGDGGGTCGTYGTLWAEGPVSVEGFWAEAAASGCIPETKYSPAMCIAGYLVL
jgi:hypothetical protein